MTVAAVDVDEWGGRASDDRLRGIGGRASQVAREDRDLLDLVVDLDATRQRSLAIWVARTACEDASVASRPDVAAALDALGRGEPLPPPLDRSETAYQALFPGPSELVVEVFAPAVRRRRVIDPAASAMDALLGAAHPDPLRAIVEALAGSFAGQADAGAWSARVRTAAIE